MKKAVCSSSWMDFRAEFSYDLSGNRTRIKTSGGAAQELEYDTHGNIVGMVDSKGENLL